MGSPFQLFELQFSSESAFCENAESPSSNTWAKRIPVLSYSFETAQERIVDGGLRARLAQESLSHIGARGATLEFTTYWIGHLSTSSGALTQTWQNLLLGYGLGGKDTSQVGGTVSSASSAVSYTTSGATAVPGAIVRVGAKGDGRGNGQAAVVSAFGSNIITSITALDAQPNAADVVYATQMAYHDESGTNLSSVRFLLGYVPTGAQYHLMGGQLTGLTINVPASGGLPTITWRYAFAYWQRQTTTIPSAVTLESHFCGPIAGGSFFINDVTAGGTTPTTTRAVESLARLQLDVSIETSPILGGVLNGTYQTIGGWARTNVKSMLSFDLPWKTAYETWFDTLNSATNNPYKHVLFTGSVGDGSRQVGFYCPRIFPIGNRPSRPVDVNRQAYVTVQARCDEGPTTTNELTRSAFRLFAG